MSSRTMIAQATSEAAMVDLVHKVSSHLTESVVKTTISSVPEHGQIGSYTWKTMLKPMSNPGVEPGPQGHWIITARCDGYVQLSPVEWPNWYIYMENNCEANVRGGCGDPGPQGHFCLQKV